MMANKMRVPRTYVSKVENDKAVPTLGSLEKIAKALGTTEGAVKLRAFRAYERLRRDLVGLVDEEQAA